jgi:CRISPR/Cas system CSM-associated protein Csm2 small subunit
LNATRLNTRASVRRLCFYASVDVSENAIENTRAEIDRLKTELADAKQDRQNKLAYDALAEQLQPYATRTDTERYFARFDAMYSSLVAWNACACTGKS